MKRILSILVVASLPAVRAAGDVETAKAALRDGLWEVARAQTAGLEGGDARLVTLETYAREGRWEDVLATLSQWRDAGEPAFALYKAAAFLGSGKPRAAFDALEGKEFGEGEAATRAAAIEAAALLECGDARAAAAKCAAASLASADPASRSVAAAVAAANGARGEAEEIWRWIVDSPDSSDSLVKAAALDLSETAALEKAAARLSDSPMRLAVSVRLGRLLVESGGDVERGAGMVSAAIAESPDAEGAMDACASVAGAYLDCGEAAKSVEWYRRAVETWPAAARDFAVREGLGWALAKTSAPEEAAEEFARAAELASGDEERARAFLEQGDALSAASRGAEAMAKYRTVLEKYPRTQAGERLKRVMELRDEEARGRELYANFRFKEAREVFASLSVRDPSRKPRMDYLEMLCLYGEVRDAEASRKAKDLAAGCPDPAIRAEATLWLAKFFYNARQWSDSMEMFEDYALKLAPASVHAPSALLWASRAAFACNGFQKAVDLVSILAKTHPDAPEAAEGRLVQGEALVELSRFDEAILVLETAAADSRALPRERRKARVLMADALFAMGADNSSRYAESLKTYSSVLLGDDLDEWERMSISYKSARCMERMERAPEAIDAYYSGVVNPYVKARERGANPPDDARAVFVRAAFRLADVFEGRGENVQAANILKLVTAADAGSPSRDAKRRLQRLQKKGIPR